MTAVSSGNISRISALVGDRAIINQLRADLDEAHETIRQLRERLTGDRHGYLRFHKFGLRPISRKLLGILVAHAYVSYDRLIFELWNNDPPLEWKTSLRVHLHVLRKSLRPFGIYIHTQFGECLYMTEDNKKKVRRIINSRAAATNTRKKDSGS